MVNQVHADGVDYEKSTSYQRLVVELFYTATILCQKNGIRLSDRFMQRLERMFEFVQHYIRPDGSIPLIGDADDGRLFRTRMSDDINDHRHVLSVGAILFNRGDFKVAAGSYYQDALWLFGGEGFEKYQMVKIGETAVGSRAFPVGGFYIMRTDNVHVMIDAGDIGMGGMGGHGHNDTLSFEYWANGKPLIVDSGTYAYTFDVAARQEMRGTRSHNTIVVDRKEIATFVGLWMIAADSTRPNVLRWHSAPEVDELEAEHHGFESLVSPIVYRRHFRLNKNNGDFEITDTLFGSGKHTLESYLHFSPDCVLTLENSEAFGGEKKAQSRDVGLAKSEKNNYIVSADKGSWSIGPCWYSRSYGVRERTTMLKLSLEAELPCTIALSVRAASTLNHKE